MAKRLAHVTGFPVPADAPLDLEVHAGEVVRVVGPNGAGKTSLLRALAGLESWLRPASVQVPPCGFAMQTAMDSLIGLTVDGEFTLRDRRTPRELIHFADRDVATLSAGEARQVAIAVAAGERSLLLFDEPSEGLDLAAHRRMAALMQEVTTHGAAVVVADHGDHWMDLADRTVALGHATESPFLPFDAPMEGAHLISTATHRSMGDRTLRLPAFDLAPGFHALVGPNGCGKTRTLLHLLESLTEPIVRMMPAQARDLLHDATVTGCLRGVDSEVRSALTATVPTDRHPWSLSGGEQQRVALAKVLGTSANIYLLDEPEAHLDPEGRHALHDALAKRIADGACVLAATHDQGLVAASQTITSMEGP